MLKLRKGIRFVFTFVTERYPGGHGGLLAVTASRLIHSSDDSQRTMKDQNKPANSRCSVGNARPMATMERQGKKE